MPYHYYLLAGESLRALNKLIEYEKLLTDFRVTDFRQLAAEAMDMDGPETNAARLQTTLSTHFTTAQVRGYQEKLGFGNPPIEVRGYDGGALYRAYKIFPKIAMNPGTSKANFGLGDLLRTTPAPPPGERVAIYISHEDYKGKHFVPPEAVPISPAELEHYNAREDTFEYYLAYDEGVATPEDFDPKAHRHESWGGAEASMVKGTHNFLIQGKTLEALLAYENAQRPFLIKEQDFRNELEEMVLKPLLDDRLPAGIEDRGDEPLIRLLASRQQGERNKAAIESVFTVRDVRNTGWGFGALYIVVAPRSDSLQGKIAAALLAKVGKRPRRPDFFGFDISPEERSAQFTPTMTGFPYMKIESHEAGEAQLLVFRMPPHVKTIVAPKDCTVVPLEDYAALAGSEKNLSLELPATHVFRFGGESLEILKRYAAEMTDYTAKEKALRDSIESLLKSAAPDAVIDHFEIPNHTRFTDDPRQVKVDVPQEVHSRVIGILKERFDVRAIENAGITRDKALYTLTAKADTEKSAIFADALANVPYMPSFYATKLYQELGFGLNGGYNLLTVETWDAAEQQVLTHHFPPYITHVETPQDCVRVTREEALQLLVDAADIQARRILPPRPPHFSHLPSLSGSKGFAHARNKKKERESEGIPLHEKTVSGWFRTPK